MAIGITSIGIANPKYRRSQQETAELLIRGLNLKPSERRLLKAIYKATGIEHRHSVLSDYSNESGEFDFLPNIPGASFPSTAKRMDIYKENAAALAIEAIENCLSNVACDKSNITHVITVSCTGMYAPGIDIEIVQRLNLNSSTKRTAINFMGCYGAFNALKVADSICKAEPNATVLIVCVELCTIHLQDKMSMDHIISNAIFADGAAAALIQSTAHVNKSLNLEAFHCDLLPQSSKEMAWHIADSGFDIVLSSYVPQAIESGIAEFMNRMLTQNKLSMSDIDFYAIHPGGLKILKACEDALNIAEEKNKYAYQVLRDYGNMSSATILFVLKAMMDDMKAEDHNKMIFSCAFGPGLTLESMLLKTNQREIN